MSTINSITSTIISTFQGVEAVTGTTPVEAPVNNAPAFQETLTTQGRAFALGLGAPRNHGDIEAIFAEIATKYGAEVSKANDFSNAAATAVRSTALAAAAGSLAFFATFNTIMITAEANIKTQNQVIGQKTQQITALEAEKAPLVARRDALNAEFGNNVGQIAQNVITIAGLGTQLAGVEIARATACGLDAGGAACRDLTAQSNSLQSQIRTLEGQNSTLSARNSQISAEVSTLNGQINELQRQIDTATSERNAAVGSRNASQNAYNVALATLNVFAAVLIPFAVGLALGQAGAGARASFDLGPDQNGFDNAIAQAVNRLADLSDEMGNLSQMRQALFQTQPSPTEGLTLPDSPPATDVGESGAVDSRPGTEPVQLPEVDANAPVSDAPPPVSPQAETPPVETALPKPTTAVEDGAPRQAAMESLRQLLANLPLRTDDLLPDPVPVSGGTGDQPPGIPAEPQNAFDIVRQLLEDMLPPGVGNAEEVATRAGELAAALALVRGALGQVAQSEAAQTPQVPGASGRLTLVI
jgi:cell division protein FtsB